MPSRDRWEATWRELGAPLTPNLIRTFDDLIARYSEPHRRYHTVRHLDECFASLAEIRALAEHPAEVDVALWFHDAIYQPRSNGNEARSAELATAATLDAGMPAGCAARIADLIMATCHAAAPRGRDAQVLVDADLSILGAPAGRFAEYERQIREEYSWVPEATFKAERRKILEEFLARPAVFNTPLFRERYEDRARANIGHALDALGV